MSHMLYGVSSRETVFNGEYDFEDMRKDAFCWDESDDREESLKIARKYSDAETIHVWRSGIMRNVYQWSAIEIEDDEVIECEVKIFDPLDRFKKIKTFAESAHTCKCDLISYLVGTREQIGEFKRGNHVCYLYRYEDTVFGDFTAYEENGNLLLPENFCDYGIMNPGELMLAVCEGVDFWNDLEVEDPEMKLMYRVFNGN